MAKNLPSSNRGASASEANADTIHMTVKQAAEYFGVSREAVRLWIKSGKVQAVYRPSGRVWYVVVKDKTLAVEGVA